ncbi:MAG: S8 family serine peptidase [Thermoanaerobaculia bacterium]
MKRSLWPAAAVLLCSLSTSQPTFAQAEPTGEVEALLSSDAASAETLTDAAGRIAVFVELRDTPAAAVYGSVLAAAERSGGAQAREAALPEAIAAGRAQFAKIQAAQGALAPQLALVGAEEIYRVSRAGNGFAVRVDPTRLAALRQLPGVMRIHLMVPEVPTNSTSVKFIGTPSAWGNTIGLPFPVQGEGLRIGIIDTGIDYQHANFGGTGLLTDYQANDRTIITDGFFPSAKVVGGTDFAGDAYTGSNAPVPDPDPMDCNGHGSHVAGTAAGFGVNSDGTTYTGTYGPGTPFASLRIGPGTAPRASLYALRVFGCGGSTGLTSLAIDWAVDPNGDSDFSDHLDVINMSLGSAYGGANTSTAISSENAALAGVIVVASAGNSGDNFFIVGSPASSGRSVAVANSGDDGVAGSVLVVNSPAVIAGNYSALPAAFTPAPPAPSGQTANIVLVNDGSGTTSDGCQTPFVNAAAVAGNIALIDRGVCGFINKVDNARINGAIGAIVVNNVPGDPNLVLMGGSGFTITIPSVFISFNDGATIKAQLAGTVNATLAAATLADVLNSSSSRGPRRASSPIRLKPDLSAPGTSITSTQSGVTCPTAAVGCITPNASGFIPDNQTLTISGTSMAAPHMAGILALLRQLHPDWSIEELKALAMNGALHDLTLGSNGAGAKYGPNRIGAGRVDVPNSATAQVTASNADEAGLVSVSFKSEILGSQTEVKSIRLTNHGSTSQTYDLVINTLIDAPGVSFSIPGASTVTVPAGDSVEFDVQMSANAALMDHVKEASVTPIQAAPGALAGLGNLSRHWLTEEAGYVELKQGGVTKLRVPLFSALRPVSTMSAPSTITTGGAGTGSTTIPLSGTDVCTGTLGPGPTCTGTFPTDDQSLVTPFELQVVSPRDTTLPAQNDLQYAGVAYNATTGQLMFGISTWGDWSPLFDNTVNIYIDSNEDGTWDRILFNVNPGTLSTLLGNSQTQQDVHINAVFNIATSGVSASATNLTNRLSPAVVHSVLYDNNVMFLTATPAQLGFTAGDTTFRWRVVTCPGSLPLCLAVNSFKFDEAAGPFFWNYNAQGLNFNGTNLAPDLNGATLPVTWNTANMTTNGSLGALLLHHHNRQGERSEVVVLEGSQTADLAITKSVAPANPALGANATYTITVSNSGPGAATGVVVTDLLPDGMTYVSDDGGGAYSSATGLWTVGSLANAGTATLHIVASADSTDEQCNTATITSGTPLDPNPANNKSEVCLMAPRSSDLGLAMSVSSPTVLVGGAVSYLLTVTNTGVDPAYSVDVNEAFPMFPALNPTGYTASQGVYNPGTGLWQLASLNGPNAGPLAPSATATLSLNFTAPNTAGPLTLNGMAAAPNADPDTANNTASATTTVLSPATVSGTKTVAGSFREGTTVTYTVVLSNSSQYDQQDNPGNEFTDVLPAQLTLVSASASSGTAVATVATNTVAWNGVVPHGGSVTITITATINAGTALQTVSNQGTASYDSDGNGVNEASATTDDPAVGGTNDPTSFVVSSPAQVGATKTFAPGEFTVGSAVVYTIVLNNTGTNAQLDNPGPEFTDVLPSTLTLVSASATSGNATANTGTNTVTWNGSIPAAGSVTLTINAVIASIPTSGQISNQGFANIDSDGNGSNESTVPTDDPALPGAADATVITVQAALDIPTLGELGLGLLATALAALGLLWLRRRAL